MNKPAIVLDNRGKDRDPEPPAPPEPEVKFGEDGLPAPQVTFVPVNDQVLLALDMKVQTTKLVGIPPKALPSGRVLAVGKGVFCAGVGYLGSQLQRGDHVSVELRHGMFRTLPLDPAKGQVFIVISESHVLGALGDAGSESAWYTKYDGEPEPSAPQIIIPR